MTGPVTSKRVTAYATVALGAAMLIGAAAGYTVGRRHERSAGLPKMTLLGVTRETLLDSLDLTPQQRVRIDSVLDDAARRAESVVDTLMTQVRAVTNETRREVRSALDDRQRMRFDSLMSGVGELRMRTPVPPRPTRKR